MVSYFGNHSNSLIQNFWTEFYITTGISTNVLLMQSLSYK